MSVFLIFPAPTEHLGHDMFANAQYRSGFSSLADRLCSGVITGDGVEGVFSLKNIKEDLQFRRRGYLITDNTIHVWKHNIFSIIRGYAGSSSNRRVNNNIFTATIIRDRPSVKSYGAHSCRVSCIHLF